MSLSTGKIRKIKRVVRAVCVVAIIALCFNVIALLIPDVVESPGYLQAAIQCASIVFAVLILKDELSETQRLEESEFIISLNDRFSSNEGIKKVFQYSIYEMSKTVVGEGNKKKMRMTEDELTVFSRLAENSCEKPNQTDLSCYLTFFEGIYILLERETISWEVLDELFKYRFFSCIHSDYVQDERLVRMPYNFKNIYYLELLWMEYNDNDPERIVRMDNTLQQKCQKAGKSLEYKVIIDEMENKKHLLSKIKKARKK